MTNRITKSYKGKQIEEREDGDKTYLFIQGNDIPYTRRNGRYWSYHSPYVDYSSLYALAKSLIDLSSTKQQQDKE